MVLSVGYRGDQVQEAIGEAHGTMTVAYSYENEPLGTGGGLRKALGRVESDPVVVLNGDSYTDPPLAPVLASHLRRRAAGTLVLTRVAKAGRFGRVEVGRGGAVRRFVEKQEGAGGGWVNAGIYLLGRALVASIPTARSVSLEREVFPSWVGRGLYAHRARRPFIDIGTPESYARAERFFAEARRT